MKSYSLVKSMFPMANNEMRICAGGFTLDKYSDDSNFNFKNKHLEMKKAPLATNALL